MSAIGRHLPLRTIAERVAGMVRRSPPLRATARYLKRIFEKSVKTSTVPLVQQPARPALPRFGYLRHDGAGPLPSGFASVDAKALASVDFIYAPVDSEYGLDSYHLDGVRLAVLSNDVDFVLVSDSLAELPSINISNLRNHVVFKTEIARVFLKDRRPERTLCGIVLRLPRDRALPLKHVDEVFGLDCRSIEFPGIESLRHFDPRPYAKSFAPANLAKPCVFILPAMFAVGGVERLTVAIVRELRQRYSFIVVITERAVERQGSLQKQLIALADGVYDLAEIAPSKHHLVLLEALKNAYRPDLVWICNGSPWICDNALALRDLFHDAAIVDQEVYDTRVGWVERYREAGIQSYDRFIAINQKIRQHFVDQLQMDPKRIDLIYHAVEKERFSRFEASAEERELIRVQYGLPPADERFLFAGRLTAQKRPLDFLELVSRAQQTGCTASFVMVGDGELDGEVEAFIAARKLKNLTRIRFTDRMAELLLICDGLIMTSAFEGLPIVMLEALSCGLPVLATDVGDIRLFLDLYGSGATVPEDADASLFFETWTAWRQALPQYRQAARANAEDVRRTFASPAVAERYHASWQQALRDRAASLGRSAN